MAPKNQCLPRTMGLIHIWSYRDCDSTKETYTVQNRQNPSTENRKQTWSPTLHLLRKDQPVFSNRVSPYSRIGSMPRSSWSTQNDSMLFCSFRSWFSPIYHCEFCGPSQAIGLTKQVLLPAGPAYLPKSTISSRLQLIICFSLFIPHIHLLWGDNSSFLYIL